MVTNQPGVTVQELAAVVVRRLTRARERFAAGDVAGSQREYDLAENYAREIQRRLQAPVAGRESWAVEVRDLRDRPTDRLYELLQIASDPDYAAEVLGFAPSPEALQVLVDRYSREIDRRRAAHAAG